MSVTSASILKRSLQEKRRSANRGKIVGRYVILAGTFMMAALGYSAISYMAALPAQSRPGAANTPSASVQTAPAKAEAPQLNEPENGVKLLLSIFSRLGASGPQLAYGATDEKSLLAMNMNMNMTTGAKGNLRFRDSEGSSAEEARMGAESQTQFAAKQMQNAADPALSIRPQNKRSADDAIGNASGNTFAGGGGGGGNAGQAPGAPASQAVQQYAASNAGVGSRVVSENPYIREFMPSKPAQDSARESRGETAKDLREAKSASARRQVNIMDEPVGRMRADAERAAGADKADRAEAGAGAESVTGIIRPSEQPGLFKYVREYLKENPKNMPAPPPALSAATPMAVPPPAEGFIVTVPAGAGKSRGENEGALKKSAALNIDRESDHQSRFSYMANAAPRKAKARASKGEEYQRIAFLPPNAVHGINGLPLGATTNDTVNFLKSRGKISKVIISGFQVFTLRNERGQALLQAYMRDNHLEALRLFNSTFVPPQLDVNLGEDLPSMKAKFGEPAFILEEPHGKTRAPGAIAKNYVYPISQVSFQLSRPNAGAAPQVLSMFLFRFL